MGFDVKQVAIYIGLLLVFATFTLIAPFYPKIAEDKGIPIWLIGCIFSLNPLANLITSLLLGKYMNAIGRKNIVIVTFIFSSLSMFFLSPIEDCDMVQVIILSVISRILGGIGAGCLLTAITTIFISDYPDKIQVMIGRMEGAIGIGLISGPLIGEALFIINLLVAMIVVGGIIIIFTPLA